MTLLLILDDDPAARRVLAEAARRLGFDAEAPEVSGEGLARAALARLASDEAPVGLVLLDPAPRGADGPGLLRALREAHPGVPVVAVAATGSIDAAVAAVRAGARDFLVKPVGLERLGLTLRNALAVEALEDEVRHARARTSGTLGFRDLVTRSPEMERAVKLAKRAAASMIPVLIEGESGVGKEVLARAVQGSGERRAKPFVAVNCGALPANLIESILFGHEKGAFTGAAEKHAGKFAEANGGTLFLDEVGELPLEAQVKLLRALQEGEIDPVGARRPVKVDFRLISATNRDLMGLVRAGRFREDLYYRLAVFPLSLPPLRRRREDVPDLARRFLARSAAEEGRAIRGVSAEAMALLRACDWPGNVRQLENAVFRAVVLCDGDELAADDFPQVQALVHGRAERRTLARRAADRAAGPDRAPPFPGAAPAWPAPTGAAPAAPAWAGPPGGTAWPPREEPPAIAAPPAPGRGSAPPALAGADPDALRLLDAVGEVRKLDEVEGEAIKFAIQHYRGQMTRVARELGIGRSTLYRKLKELGLADEAGEEAGEGEAARDGEARDGAPGEAPRRGAGATPGDVSAA